MKSSASTPSASEPVFLKTSFSVALVKTKSQVKFCPPSTSSMTADLVSLKRKFVTSEIVKSSLDEFSIIPLVSELSEAMIFSPAINDPDTLTKLTFAPVALLSPAPPSFLDSTSLTKPVAPDVFPVNLTPVECVAVRRGLGVPDKSIWVNICTSKRYSLWTASVLPSVPVLCSKALDLATPIWNPLPVPPLVDASVNNFISLYAVVSPETSPISGVLYAFVTWIKFPSSKLVTPALNVSKSLAFGRSINVCPIFSTSYPRTYAFPGEHPIASKSSAATSPLSVEAPFVYTPVKSSAFTELSMDSLASNINGLTV